MKWCNISLKKL